MTAGIISCAEVFVVPAHTHCKNGRATTVWLYQFHLWDPCYSNIINPRHTCAARVMVLGLCVCVDTYLCTMGKVADGEQYIPMGSVLTSIQKENGSYLIVTCYAQRVLQCLIHGIQNSSLSRGVHAITISCHIL